MDIHGHRTLQIQKSCNVSPMIRTPAGNHWILLTSTMELRWSCVNASRYACQGQHGKPTYYIGWRPIWLEAIATRAIAIRLWSLLYWVFFHFSTSSSNHLMLCSNQHRLTSGVARARTPPSGRPDPTRRGSARTAGHPGLGNSFGKLMLLLGEPHSVLRKHLARHTRRDRRMQC